MLVLALVAGLRWWNPDFPERLERLTYDLRVRATQNSPAPTATNLAFVAMDDASISALRHGLLGRPYGLYWPRHVYGRLVEELSAQDAKAIAFDVLFGELRPDHAPVVLADGTGTNTLESDAFFARQMKAAGNIISAFTVETTPPDLFATNSLALGDISTEKDADGVLRRIKSFSLKWHPAFKSAMHQWGVNLDQAIIAPDKIVLPLPTGKNFTAALDRNGNFDLNDFVEKIPKGWKRFNRPFERIWDLGIELAAQELKLDLDRSEVDLPHGKIILHGANGITRLIPVDANGFFYINWQLTVNSPVLVRASVEELLKQDKLRLRGETNNLSNDFHERLVIIGSAAQGNDLTDRGATPLENNTLLVSKHWNVANSVITGQFIRRLPLPLEILTIVLLGTLTALLTWRMRAIAGSAAVLLLLLAYGSAAVWAFTQFHYWLPVIYPLGGAVLLQHGLLLIHRVVFEEQDKRRVKSVFSKLVSPNVVNELLAADELSFGGTRREATVFFFRCARIHHAHRRDAGTNFRVRPQPQGRLGNSRKVF